jgi:hypothetical protein
VVIRAFVHSLHEKSAVSQMSYLRHNDLGVNDGPDELESHILEV